MKSFDIEEEIANLKAYRRSIPVDSEEHHEINCAIVELHGVESSYGERGSVLQTERIQS